MEKFELRARPSRKDLYQPRTAEAPILTRPAGYMENPFIGYDGKDYHSPEALRAAKEERFRRIHYYISLVLRREYPLTREGFGEMRSEVMNLRIGIDRNLLP